MEPNPPPAIRTTASDRMATALGMLTSGIDLLAPGFGSVFGGLLGEILPDLREKRVEAYLARLAQRLAMLEGGLEALRDRVDEVAQEHLALIHDGAVQATRATTQARIDHVAAVVAGGLTDAEAGGAVAARRVLRTLGDLDDVELETLARLAGWCAEGRRGRPLGDPRLSDLLIGQRDDNAAFGAYQLAFSHLESLGLVMSGEGGNVVASYPTAAGELVLLKAGLHPDPPRAFGLAGPPQARTFHDKIDQAESSAARERAAQVIAKNRQRQRAKF